MAEQQIITPGRLASFSDGVIAIIITIMVLELHAPADADPSALFELWPVFLSYVLSFLMVAVYWINHHYLFHFVKQVNNRILWSNILLLFCLSLVPFATAYLGLHRLNAFAVALEAFVLLMCALVYLWMYSLLRDQFADRKGFETFNRFVIRKNLFALAVYAVAMGVAFLHPGIAFMLLFGVGAMYIAPGKRIEKAEAAQSSLK